VFWHRGLSLSDIALGHAATLCWRRVSAWRLGSAYVRVRVAGATLPLLEIAPAATS
jgi:hypothetical protein